MSERLRILMVEDNPGDAELIGELLQGQDGQTFEIECVPRLSAALARIGAGGIDLILLDLSLPDSSGLDTVRAMCASAVNIPIVVMTGNADEHMSLAAIHVGAQDYVFKGQATGVLLARILRYAVERFEISARLRESEAHYRLLADHMSDTVWLMDINMKTTYISPSVQKFRGYTLQELERMTPEQNLVPGSYQVVMNYIAAEMPKMLADPAYVTPAHALELEFYRKDGSTYWSENKFRIIRDEHGAPVSILGEGRDISERKQAEELLKMTERRFRALIEKAPDGVVMVSGQTGKIIYASPSARKMFGFDSDESIVADPMDATHPDDLPRVLAELAELIHNPEHVPTLQYRYRHADGSWRWVESTFSNMLAEPGVEAIVINFRDVTERKLAEEALRMNEEKLRDVFVTMEEGMALNELVYDELGEIVDYRILEVNPAFERISTLTREQVMGRLATEIYQMPAAYITAFWKENLHAEHEIKAELYTEDTKKWRHVSTSRPVHNKFVTIFFDITEQKNAEIALRESEARLKIVTENAPDIIVELDRQGRIIFISRVLEGFRMEEIIGKDFCEWTLAEYHPLMRQKLEQVFLSGQLAEFENLGQGANGDIRWYLCSLSPVNVNGQTKSVIMITHDITERKQAAVDLQKRANQLTLINDVGREIAAVLNLQNVLEVAARRIHQAFGFYHVALFILDRDRNELVMKARAGNFAHIFPQGHCVSLGEGVVGWAATQGKRLLANDVNCEPKYKNHFPELLPTRSELSLPLMVGQRVVGVLDVQSPDLNAFNSDDITVLETLAAQVAVAIENAGLYDDVQVELVERKKAEAELLEHRAHLEELVKVRTEALSVAKEQAEAANRAKSDFLAVMSHEIRTPLNGVLGLAHLLLQTGLTDKQRNYLTNLQISGESLLATINDILDFSKIESGKLNIEATKFDLDDVLNKLSSMLTYRAQEKGLALVVKTEPELPRLLVGDPARLGQVLLNLVGNAVKFTETGEVVVRTALRKQGSDQVVLEFSVTDTGIGMTEQQLAHLFEPFTQADSSTSRKYGGTGLGLTISQRLVQLMRGQIQVQSRMGQGSVFSFTLPLQRQSDQGSETATTGLTGESVPFDDAGEKDMQKLQGVHILLVEDNEINQLVAVEILENMGISVSVASLGEEALEMVAREHFDAVLMDIQMPGMDGYQTTLKIRQSPGMNDAGLPIIAMTAHAMEGARDKALAAGLNDYVSKPVHVAQLTSVLLHWIGRPQEKVETPSQRDEQATGTPPGVFDIINADAALTRLGNNKALYLRLLSMFQSEHAQIGQQIRAALDGGDLELARRLAHTLKGVAGTIGADELVLAARQLEGAIVTDKLDGCDAALELVEQRLADALGALGGILA